MQRRPLSALLLAVVAPAAMAGCWGEGDHTSIGPAPVGTSPAQLIGQDQKQNGEISLDVAKLTARIVGKNRLSTEIPLQSLHTGKGNIEVALTRVDGTTTHATQTLSYDLNEGQTEVLHAQLDLSRDLASQAELVEYNLVIVGKKGPRVTRSVLHVVPPYEVQVQGPQRISADKQVSYRVITRCAVSRQPLADKTVSFSLVASMAEEGMPMYRPRRWSFTRYCVKADTPRQSTGDWIF